MLTLPCTIAAVLSAFAPLLPTRVCAPVRLLVIGPILAPGKRTGTSVLRVMGKADGPHFQNYHRVLTRARWPALRGGRMLLQILLPTFAPAGPVVLGIDAALERRRGEKITARGSSRDPVRSSHAHVVQASGLRWVSLVLLTPITWATRVWALPPLTALAPSERDSQHRRWRPRTLLGRARQAVWLVRGWLPARELIGVGGGPYATLAWLDAVRHAGCVLTRLRLEAALYDPAPPREPRPNGRPREKGKRLPTLERVSIDSTTPWETVRIAHWYGAGERQVHSTSATAVWHHSGLPVVPIRWVLIRDPLGRFAPQALLAANPQPAPAQVLRYFVRRWQLAATFEEARAHLGRETQRQWRQRALARTTPALLALYAIITSMAPHLLGTGAMPVRRAAWYPTEEATFSDAIALVRRCLWHQGRCSLSDSRAEVVNIPRALLARRTAALCYAA